MMTACTTDRIGSVVMLRDRTARSTPEEIALPLLVFTPAQVSGSGIW
jgi:hypothetical protein